eukprot:CAMPEP_0116137890 /NCGR_PEP_ID=MMETSP0329-20121206/12482_1 /TAXON_ID=697910 /ORGANISM="Pseudo-nitzschia arenysensis, Strain B593" /LENGTH=842 /DNA_ID=CAMNT_0003632821 /DNA_START=10 /DNA_END=2538 /DNA_ORIENTATION=+
MSWLSSVNNLLENLDGQAETVAETVAEQATSSGISNNLRRLNNTLANNASALTNNISNARNNNFGGTDDYYDESVSSFEDDDFGDDEEFTTDEEDDEIGGANSNEVDTGKSGKDSPVANDVDESAITPVTSTVQIPPSTELSHQTNDQPEKEPSKDSSKSDILPANQQISSLQNLQKKPIQKATTSKKVETNPEGLKIDKLSAVAEMEVAETAKKTSAAAAKTNAKLDSATAPSPAMNTPPSIPPPDASINPKTESTEDSVPEQKQKQQKDETRLLKKQQQQHQQVLASKNKTIQSLESQLVKLREELTRGAAEHEKLNQRTKDIDAKLQSSEREIEAQANELLKAGEEMEKIRSNAKEEREDLLDDHEDELEDIQRNHQAALDKMRQDYEKTIADWKNRYESEESLRQQEGGDSIKELQEANKREREALIKLAEVTDERTALQAKLDQVVGQETTLKQQVESSLESAETVAAREQRARDELDEAAAMHAKQMAQRQRREAELEQTILEMGQALTIAKQQLQQQQGSVSSPNGKVSSIPTESNQQETDGSYYKEQFEQVAEELENVRVQLTMETQRREALKQELSDVSKERKQELSLSQSRQQQHDRKVTDLEATIHRLQDSIRASKQQSNSSVERATDDSFDLQKTNNATPNHELETAKQEISSLSEQLYRQQALAKNAKSEILALKGRLQAANARADEAERARYDSKYSSQPRSRTFDVEGGSSNRTPTAFSVRRRVKGGSSRGVRSIRSALPCFGSGRASAESNPGMEQVALTIDAIDSWMVDTGSFMRHEPFARLGLLLYLMILHLWSFALVVFHTTEVEHGDFGSMDSNPRHWREHT